MTSKKARALMVLGTASNVGKSLIAAGLCRLLKRNGIRIVPFKSQNMSNNSAVTVDGGEIGRAQAVQAQACGLPLHSDMNPILLKPEGDKKSQIILRGKPFNRCSALEYRTKVATLWPSVTAAYDSLSEQFDVVVIEGAGSCAEINLDWDISNMKTADYADADCILVGDIDRGGVFAQLIGTIDLLSPKDRKRIKGIIINKFRGDKELLGNAVAQIEERTEVKVLGVLPFVSDLNIEEEDSVSLTEREAKGFENELLDIAVLVPPRISNFSDFTALQAEPEIKLRYVQTKKNEALGDPDVLILPGTKNTIGDLQFIKEAGYTERIISLADAGTEIIGICGGLQMLGSRINNPDQIESDSTSISGLGLLNLKTTLHPEKIVRDMTGTHETLGKYFRGYEIHCGDTKGSESVIMKGSDGKSLGFGNELVWGTYIHGLFDQDDIRHAWIDRCLARKGIVSNLQKTRYSPDKELDRLADSMADHLEIPPEWIS